MRKIVNLTLIIIAALSTFSQNSTGILLGANLATMSGDSTRLPDRDFRYGARAGMFWEFNVRYNTYLELGFFYSQQGAKYKNNFFDFNKEVKMLNINKIDYIQIPIIWKESYNNIYTKLGLYAEIATNAKSIWKLEYIYKDSIESYEGQYGSFVNHLRFYDMGLYLGAGFQFPTRKNITILIDFSFIHGFFPVNESDYKTEYIMRNMVFNASVGLLFEKSSKKNIYKRRR